MRNILFVLPLLTLLACHRDDDKGDHDTATCAADTAIDTAVDDTADTSAGGACTDSTGTYNIGDTWTCPDGCNTCGCLEPDVIASTNMACGDTGTPPDTGAVDTGADTGAGGDTSSTDTGTDTGSGGTDTSAP